MRARSMWGTSNGGIKKVWRIPSGENCRSVRPKFVELSRSWGGEWTGTLGVWWNLQKVAK